MKFIFTITAVCLAAIQQLVAQTNYYSQSATNLHLLSSWNTMPDGTGTQPSSFAAASQVFIIDESPVASIAGAFTVSGAGSKVIVGTGAASLVFSTGTQLISGTFDVENLATLNVQSNSTFVVGTCATGSTVNYALNGTQLVHGGTYYNFTLSGATTARTKTAQGDIVVNGDLTVGASITLAMTTFQLGGNPVSVSGTGAITTTHTATSSPLPAGKTWTQSVTFSAAGAQTIPQAVSYQSLTISGGGNNVKTSGADLAVIGTLTIASSTILDMATFQLSSATTITNSGTIRTQHTGSAPLPSSKVIGGTTLYNGAGTQTIVPNTYTTLNISGGDRIFSPADSIRITGTFTTGAGNLTFTGSSISLAGGTQAITVTGQTAMVFNNLLVAAAGVKTFSNTGIDITIEGVLDIPGSTTRTLAIGTNRLVFGPGSTKAGNGILTTANISANPLPDGVSWPYIVNYNSTATQFVAAGTYGRLIISGNGNATANGDITVTDSLTVSAGTFVLGTNFLYGPMTGNGGTGIGGAGIISTANTSATPIPAGRVWTQTVNYVAAAGQTIVPAISYQALGISGGSANIKTASSPITVNGTVTIASGTILDMGTFDLSATTIANSGTLRTQSTSAAPLPSGKSIAGTVEYNASGPQTVVPNTYTALNLTGGDRTLSASDSIKISSTWTLGSGNISAAGSSVALSGTTQAINITGQTALSLHNLVVWGSGVKTFANAGCDITITGELVIIGGRTVAFGTNTLLLGGGASVSGLGNITTASVATEPVPAGRTWTTNMTFSAATQNVPGGTYMQNLTLSTTGVKTATGDIDAEGILTVSATLNMTTFNLTGNFTPAGTGAIQTQSTAAFPVPVNKTWTQPFTFNAGASQNIPYGQYTSLTLGGGDRVLDNTGTIKATGSVNFGTGNITATGSTLELNGATTQTITLPVAGVTFNNLHITAGTVKTIATGPLSVTGTLMIGTNMTLALGANMLASVNTLSGDGIVTTGNTGTTPIPAGITWPYTMVFNANATQSVPGGNYAGGLSCTGTSGTRARNMTDDISVGGILMINANAVLVIGGNTLTINGTLDQTGSITGGATSNLVIGAGTDDAGALLMTQTSAVTRSLNNLTLGRNTGADALILGNETRVLGTVTITDGTLAADGNLVFVSTGTTASAQLAPVTGTGNISGQVVVQRFIAGRTASSNAKWRFLTSSVTTNNGIDDNWQQQIHITGAGSGGSYCPSLTANSNGFDATSTQSPSMYTWNRATQAWSALGNTNATELQAGMGYRVFIRGDRVTQGCNIMATTPATPANVVLSATGTLAIGTQHFTCASAPSAYELIGNPFQATIDWDAAGITKTNLAGTIYGYKSDGTANGAYGSYNGGIGTNGMTRYIAPGTAFWVLTDGTGNGSLSIPESAKAVTEGGFGYFKTSALSDVLRIKLSKDTLENIDEVVLALKDGSSWGYNSTEDAGKYGFQSNQLALYTPASAQRYAICRVPSFDSLNNRINVDVKTAIASSYSLRFSGLESFTDASLTAVLTDTYTGTTHPIGNNAIYTFTTPDAASTSASRFYITFTTTAGSLPVKLLSFDAKRQKTATALEWQTASEVNSDRFEIQRSTDNKEFETIGSVKAATFSTSTRAYAFSDIAPVTAATNYYRLKQLDRDGSFTYSRTVSITSGDARALITQADIKLYPVPVADQLTLEVNGDKALVNPDLRMYDMFGKRIHPAMQLDGNTWTISTAGLEKGIYIIQLENAGITTQLKVVKN
jgi:hypothetical protein